MSSHSSFEIERFTNRNGTPSWRISGGLQGVRIRKNFKSREEAVVETAKNLGGQPENDQDARAAGLESATTDSTAKTPKARIL